MIGLIVVGLLLALAGFGIGNYTGSKQAPHTTPGPGPTAPSGRVAIDNTNADCSFCDTHDGKKNPNQIMSDGTTDCSVCNRTALVDVSLPGKLSALSATAKKLVADAVSRAKDSTSQPLKLAPPQGAIVELSGANGLQVEINGAQAGSGEEKKFDDSQLPADVKKILDESKKDGVKVLDYVPYVKDHHDGSLFMGNGECTELVTFKAK
jgi:hypothetical protein